MSELEICNARITGTMLGYEDHGMLTAMVHLSGDGWGCGFGGWRLDEYNKAEGRTEDTPLCAWFIRRMTETLEVTQWEKVSGIVRAKLWRGGNPRGGNDVVAIGHVLKDKWFEPGKELKEMGHG